MSIKLPKKLVESGYADLILKAVSGPDIRNYQGHVVYPRKGTKPTGKARVIGVYSCRMQGCNGDRLICVWPDKKRTHPCTKGMVQYSPGKWQII